jgi:altronate hydrolase
MTLKYRKIHDNDNVVVAVEKLTAGEKILSKGIEITLTEEVNKGHKIAIDNIKAGEKIIKYGHVIGHAIRDIKQGEWVHTHNLKTDLSDLVEYQYNPVKYNNIKNTKEAPAFSGYKRMNGKAGTRNEIWIINTVGCVNTSAERIAKIANEKFKSENFDGVFSFSHPYGCSQLGDDLRNTQKILAGLINNPNAGGALILGLGCENNQVSSLLSSIGNTDSERIRSFNSQDVGDEIETGINKIEELFEIVKNDKREELPISELVIGVKCGGSDGFSGITANALVGRITDIMTSYGGTVLLTEVPEMFGAEQQLMNRAKDKDTYNKIVFMINDFKKYFTGHNQPVYENPSPGNKEGGLTTLEEKSLGAIQKGGTSQITRVLDYGEVIPEASGGGLILLKAPGNDGVSSTAMTASGAAMLLFTTGRGTPLGFPVPTIKISSNTDIYNKKPNWIDFNAGRLLDSEEDINRLADELFKFIIDTASGKIKTKNELNGYKEIAIWKEGVTL